MSYSERAYFEGDHCQHCAAHDDAQLVKRRAKVARQFERESGRYGTGRRMAA